MTKDRLFVLVVELRNWELFDGCRMSADGGREYFIDREKDMNQLFPPVHPPIRLLTSIADAQPVVRRNLKRIFGAKSEVQHHLVLVDTFVHEGSWSLLVAYQEGVLIFDSVSYVHDYGGGKRRELSAEDFTKWAIDNRTTLR